MIKTLVVDDEKLARKGLISIMPWRQYGFCIVGEASDGKAAVDFIRQNTVDLAIIDLAMPVMSGLDLMKIVRREFPGISMVVLTCHADFGFIQEALRLGAIDYIVKTQLEVEKMDVTLERIAARILQNHAPDRCDCGRGIELPRPEEDGPAAEKLSEEIVESIMNAVKMIKENLREEISQDAVAKKVNLSRSYFSRCFKEVVGLSYGEYLRELKIAKSKELLGRTNKPVYWIAEQMGFRDDNYFSRFFREHTGFLPKDYRARNRI